MLGRRAHSCPARHVDRRAFLGMLGVGLAVTLSACGGSDDSVEAAASTGTPLPPIPAAHPGTPQVVSRGPAGTSHIALTVDDGFCADCVSGYVDFVKRTGIHLTFGPNGVYQRIWQPHADALRLLIERGQVQIMNHTYKHLDLTKMSEADIKADLERNEDWVQTTFGITTRPWFRPPFGRHNATSDGVAARLGWNRVLLWNGSYGDAQPLAPDVLLGEARKWLKPGTVMLGHANHPTILGLFDQVQQIMSDRGLAPVTLDEMFDTSRAEG